MYSLTSIHNKRSVHSDKTGIKIPKRVYTRLSDQSYYENLFHRSIAQFSYNSHYNYGILSLNALLIIFLLRHFELIRNPGLYSICTCLYCSGLLSDVSESGKQTNYAVVSNEVMKHLKSQLEGKCI